MHSITLGNSLSLHSLCFSRCVEIDRPLFSWYRSSEQHTVHTNRYTQPYVYRTPAPGTSQSREVNPPHDFSHLSEVVSDLSEYDFSCQVKDIVTVKLAKKFMP